MLLIHLINSFSSLEADSHSWIPKLQMVRATEDFPRSGTGMSVIWNLVNRTCDRFLLDNSFARRPQILRGSVTWKIRYGKSWMSFKDNWFPVPEMMFSNCILDLDWWKPGTILCGWRRINFHFPEQFLMFSAVFAIFSVNLY